MPLTIENTSVAPVTITCFKSSHPDFTIAAPVPVTLDPGESVAGDVSFEPTAGGLLEGTIYARSVESYEVIAQPIEVRGFGGGVAAASGPVLTFRLHGRFSNNRTR